MFRKVYFLFGLVLLVLLGSVMFAAPVSAHFPSNIQGVGFEGCDLQIWGHVTGLSDTYYIRVWLNSPKGFSNSDILASVTMGGGVDRDFSTRIRDFALDNVFDGPTRLRVVLSPSKEPNFFFFFDVDDLNVTSNEDCAAVNDVQTSGCIRDGRLNPCDLGASYAPRCTDDGSIVVVAVPKDDDGDGLPTPFESFTASAAEIAAIGANPAVPTVIDSGPNGTGGMIWLYRQPNSDFELIGPSQNGEKMYHVHWNGCPTQGLMEDVQTWEA